MASDMTAFKYSKDIIRSFSSYLSSFPSDWFHSQAGRIIEMVIGSFWLELL